MSIGFLFTNHFYKEIEGFNVQKGVNSPKALILTPFCDPKGGLFDSLTQFRLKEIAKTHRVSISNIGSKREMIVAFEKNPLVNLIIYLFHGDDSGIQLSNTEWLSAQSIKKTDFPNLAENAEIFLMSCFAGIELAQAIADTVNRTVFASINRLRTDSFGCSYCIEHHKLEMWNFDHNEQTVLYFQKNKRPILSHRRLSECASYFAEMHHYIHELSLQNGIDAQFDFANICFFNGNWDEAQHWYQIAADHGHIRSQHNLGVLWMKKQNFDLADEWLQKAAMQGHDDALYNLAVLYQKKNQKELSEIYFHRAAEKGHPAAENHFGWKYLDQNDLFNAQQWFQKASIHGHVDAMVNLAGLYENQCRMDLATIWIQKAARQGHSQAQRILKEWSESDGGDL